MGKTITNVLCQERKQITMTIVVCGTQRKKTRSCKTTFLLEMLENRQTNIRFIHLKDGVICSENQVKGKVIKTPLDPQPCVENVVTLHQYYSVLKREVNL
jgi:hypothetical protein